MGADRILLLKERCRTECFLSGDDLEFLLAEHANHLHVTPTRQPSIYQITPTRCVGIIVAPTCRLVIEPKIPLQCLFALLEPRTVGPEATSVTAADIGTTLLDFLALRLAALLGERQAAGLHRSYAERAGPGPFLQGQLDVPAQLRGGATRRDHFHCRHDDFTTNILCNQVPRGTVERLLRSPLLGTAARAALGQALRGLEGITAVEGTPEIFSRATADPSTAAYRPLLELCRLLAESLPAGTRAGNTFGAPFLLDLERVFERHIGRGILSAFAGSDRHTVTEQLAHSAGQGTGSPAGLRMRPDITIVAGNRTHAVVDSKWKRLPPHGKVTADLYQVLAYCTALGARHAVLVYPGRRDHCRAYLLPHTAVRLEVRTLRVTADAAGCARSLRRFGQAVRRTVET